jgi:hypothetical protein
MGKVRGVELVGRRAVRDDTRLLVGVAGQNVCEEVIVCLEEGGELYPFEVDAALDGAELHFEHLGAEVRVRERRGAREAGLERVVGVRRT